MSWSTMRLGDAIRIRHGYAFKSRFFSDVGDYILLTPGNCYPKGGLRLKGDKEKYFVGDIPEDFILSEGDLMVVMTDLVPTAPILGGSFRIPEDDRFLHNQRLGLVTLTDDKLIDKRFLYYLLNTHNYRAQVRGSATGATVRHTAPERIYRCKVTVPDLRDQKRIADILSAYDNLIENNRRRIQLLEQAARLLYKEWFVHLRFPGHEHVKITDGVPEGWARKSAFEVMEVLSGGTPKTGNPSYWDGEIPFWTPKDSTSYVYVFETEKTLTEEGLRNCNSKLYQKNTIFITARGTVGKINLAQTDMAMNQSCYALVGKPPLDQLFLYFALVQGVEQFRSRAVGAVFDAIIRDTFKLIPFTLPPESLIRAFTESIHPMISQIDNLLTQSRRLKKARDLLLPRLMNGEIAV